MPSPSATSRTKPPTSCLQKSSRGSEAADLQASFQMFQAMFMTRAKQAVSTKLPILLFFLSLFPLLAGPPLLCEGKLLLFATFGAIIGLLSVAYCIWSRRRDSSQMSANWKPTELSLAVAEVASASNNFATENIVGAGVFGTVYRGQLLDGRVVAIKRAHSGLRPETKKIQDHAFDMELRILSQVNHRNLVKLVGYCEEDGEKILVYKYMENGTLYDHLHGRFRNLDGMVNIWEVRIKIAVGAAKAIDYLHNYTALPTIHRDIKSTNILINVDRSAVLCDLGLSLIGYPPEYTSLQLVPAGTCGYMDYEDYLQNVPTTKLDVYALGVVLLELLTGKPAVFKGEGGMLNLVEFALPIINADRLVDIIDPRVGCTNLKEERAIRLVAQTAALCVQRKGKKRPIMKDVVRDLEEALRLLRDDDGHDTASSEEKVHKDVKSFFERILMGKLSSTITSSIN